MEHSPFFLSDRLAHFHFGFAGQTDAASRAHTRGEYLSKVRACKADAETRGLMHEIAAGQRRVVRN